MNNVLNEKKKKGGEPTPECQAVALGEPTAPFFSNSEMKEVEEALSLSLCLQRHQEISKKMSKFIEMKGGK